MMVDPWQVLEAVAAAGNLAYTVLMLYEKRVGWLFGIAASAVGVALFMHQHVYAQVGLSAYYVAMGIYGWWSWGKDDTGTLAINRRGVRFHAVMIVGGGVLAVVGGLLLKLLPDARYTGLDAFATAFSLLATWMLARKVLENWAYWVLADAVAIVLYVLLGRGGTRVCTPSTSSCPPRHWSSGTAAGRRLKPDPPAAGRHAPASKAARRR